MSPRLSTLRVPARSNCRATSVVPSFRSEFGARALGALVALSLSLLGGCSREGEPERTTFYQRQIEPILGNSCAASPSQSRCHVPADDRGNALGNLSVASYEDLQLRRDLLADYGPYGVPGLLLKALPAYPIRLTSWDGSEPQLITTDIAHVGGPLLDFTSSGFSTLETWIRNGAAENNAPVPAVSAARTPCSVLVGSDPRFDGQEDPAGADYASFDRVNEVLQTSCAAGNCHGSLGNALYLACGSTPEQKRWNYFAASDYLAVDIDSSELLRRTLAPAFGGTFHEGGVLFQSTSDADYRALRQWAEEKGGPDNVPEDAGFPFFAERVQPMLVKRGCMMLGCHSPSAFHDYRLRGGSAGHFGLAATRRNYELTLEQVALESPDPNASRLIGKNLPVSEGGMLHRGGPLFGAGGDPSACDLDAASNGPIDEQDPYCVLVAWIDRERAERMAGQRPLEAFVFVRRSTITDAELPQEFERFHAGAEVVRITASGAADGSFDLGAETSLSALCGLDPATSDARRPAVSWDGERIAFSARAAADEPWQIYVVEADGSCALEPTIAAPATDDRGELVPHNGELVHNLDPAFAPDGRLVFVSTRGNVVNRAAFGYDGPQRSPADPSRLNANLYILDGAALGVPRIRQLTFVLDQELTPAFMSDGRVIFTAEKRATGFYQLAGRRMNLDGGDYHPLFAQRPTVGHNQMTDIVELMDKNLVGVVSERGARHGTGGLLLVNRSVGVDQLSDNPDDYVQDPAAMTWPNPDFYQKSARLLDPAATGRLEGTNGAYRNPSPLPDGRLVASYAATSDLSSFDGGFELVVIDPRTGARTPLLAGGGDLLWPVAVYARQPRDVFHSRLDEANGATRVERDRLEAEVLFLDVPLMMSLVFQNTRTGREFGAALPMEVVEVLPPEPGVTSLSGAHLVQDAFGGLIVRQRTRGTVPLFGDGSARVLLPGGVPLTYRTSIRLAEDAAPQPHEVREQFQFYPGEVARQSFPRSLFNGMCGGCHGSLSGREMDVAVDPDVLTQASDVRAAREPAVDLR